MKAAVEVCAQQLQQLVIGRNVRAIALPRSPQAVELQAALRRAGFLDDTAVRPSPVALPATLRIDDSGSALRCTLQEGPAAAETALQLAPALAAQGLAGLVAAILHPVPLPPPGGSPPGLFDALQAACAPPFHPFAFGPHYIHPGQVFYATPHTLALVNLMPVLAGHVLVVSRRRVPRLSMLTPEEVGDLFATVQLVGARLEAAGGAVSLSVGLQDGAAAGQSVPHVHVHLIPRHRDDLEDNDTIYELMEEREAGLHRGLKETTADAQGDGGSEGGKDSSRGSAGEAASVQELKESGGSPSPRPASGHHTAVAFDPLGHSAGSGSAAGQVRAALAAAGPRKPRSLDDMAAEAARYRALFY